MRAPYTPARLLPLLALSVGSLTFGATAQPPSDGAAPAPARAADEQPKTLIRTYNLADMFQPTRDYPFTSAMVPPTRIGLPPDAPDLGPPGAIDPAAGGGLRGPSRGLYGNLPGGGGGGGQGADGNPRPGADDLAAGAYTMPALMQLIEEIVAPESWAGAGGSGLGSMRRLGHVLVVRQTAEAHKQIEDLLDAIRQQAGPSRIVTVRADWVRLGEEEARTLLRAGTGNESNASPGTVVDLPALLKAAGPGGHYRAQTTGFDRQTVHVASGRGRTVILDVNAQVGTNAGLYDPETSIVQAGAVLQVTPTVAPDGKSVTLDVSSVVSEWNDDETAPADNPGSRPARPATRPSRASVDWPVVNGAISVEMPPIDRLDVTAQQLRTTLRVPLNKPVLVGGMTLEPLAKNADGRQLYLILEATASE